MRKRLPPPPPPYNNSLNSLSDKRLYDNPAPPPHVHTQSPENR